MIYGWREGSRYPVDAQVVGETVEKLAAMNGGVCPPAAVVEEARSSKSPLHSIVFRLERDLAAESWYRQEARQLVNDLTIVVEGSPVRPAAFYSVSIVADDGPRVGYAPREMVVEESSLYEQALEEALRSLNGWRRRFRHLKEFAPVFDAIDQLGLDVNV